MKILFFFLFVFLFFSCTDHKKELSNIPGTSSENYEKLKKEFLSGWNTWNSLHLASHVLMPEAFAINLNVKDYANKDVVNRLMLGYSPADIRMGPHAFDGSYTSLEFSWSDLQLKIESAHDRKDLVILITPVRVNNLKTPLVLIEGGVLWNRSGYVIKEDKILHGIFDESKIEIHTTGEVVEEYYVGGLNTPYLAVPVEEEIGIFSGKNRNLQEVKNIIDSARQEYVEKKSSFAENKEVFDAMNTVLAWNTVYDPKNDRVISPVSRKWSYWNQGHVLYCWDTYFAAYQAAALGYKAIAYANAVAMTKSKTESGFVPNVTKPNGMVSNDRSQPPVGSIAVREIYRKFNEAWFLELLYEDLLGWNRWWKANRDYQGLLCYGSNRYEPDSLNPRPAIDNSVHTWFGASRESGWDGATLYKEVPFDEERSILTMWDVALNSLYVMDCRALADIAEVLGKGKDAANLRENADQYQQNIQRLWDEKTGYFRNKSWVTGEFSDVTSINGFYPMIAKAATKDQVRKILENYFFNPDEFYGEWIIPVMARSHYAHHDKSLYWDSKIWPPVNFLVYLGLRNYELDIALEAREELVNKSEWLLMKDWRERGYVRENYDPDSGMGEIEQKSDPFYHWGGLLGLMSLVEEGYIGAPDQSINN